MLNFDANGDPSGRFRCFEQPRCKSQRKLSGRDLALLRSSKADDAVAVAVVSRAIRNNLQYSPTTESIAEIFCVSARTLSRRLERAGVSFRELLEDERRKEAGYCLRETELSINEVALRNGYSDCSNFIKAFKRWYGCTPRAFRVSSQKYLREAL